LRSSGWELLIPAITKTPRSWSRSKSAVAGLDEVFSPRIVALGSVKQSQDRRGETRVDGSGDPESELRLHAIRAIQNFF